jgi:hypothetical protein
LPCREDTVTAGPPKAEPSASGGLLPAGISALAAKQNISASNAKAILRMSSIPWLVLPA